MGRKKRSSIFGLSLTEVLIVMAILIVLVLLGFTFFRSQTIKAVDAKKKSDVRTIQIAAEQYERDNDCYPPSGLTNCNPGDGLNPYLYKIPCDPKGSSYYYETEEKSCPSWYRIFASLENTQDASLIPGIGAEGGYNYYVGSPNAPVPTPSAIAQGSSTPTPSGGGGGGSPTTTPTPTPTGSSSSTPSSSTSSSPTPTPTPIISTIAGVLTDDSQIRESSPSQNYNNQSFFDIGFDFSSSRLTDGLVKFVVSGANSRPVVRARLRVYDLCTSPSASSLQRYERVYLGSHNNWAEANVTWNNAPSRGLLLASSVNVSSCPIWREFDVTPGVNGDGIYTFRFSYYSNTPNSLHYVKYSSKDGGSQRSELLVDVSG